MANCVNIKSKEFRNLLRDTNLTEKVLAAKVSLWQDDNGIDNFPTKQDIYKTMPLPLRLGIYKNEVTELQMNMINKRVGIYNKKNNETNIFISYKKIGESNNYTWQIRTNRGTLPIIQKTTPAVKEAPTMPFAVDTTIKERLFNDTNATSSVEVLTTIASSKHPLNDLAKTLLSLIEGTNLDIPITLQEGASVTVAGHLEEGFTAIGVYIPTTKEIVMAEEGSYSAGQAEATILHEILHSLTYDKLGVNNAEIIEDFRKVYEYSKTLSELADTHAYETMDEFIVALFTKAKFIKDLQNYPPTDIKSYPNLLAEILDKLLKMMGLKPKETAYSQAYSIASNILVKPVDPDPDSIVADIVYTEEDFGDLFSNLQSQRATELYEDTQTVEEFLESQFTEEQNKEIEDIQEGLDDLMGFKERFEAFQAEIDGIKNMDEVAFATAYGQDFTVRFKTVEEALAYYEEQMAQMEREILEDGDAIIGKTPIVEPAYESYLSQKTALFNFVEHKLKNLYIQRAKFKSIEFNDKIAEFRSLRDNLKIDIHSFETSKDKLALVESFFKQDVETIKSLLSNPTIDNYYLAKDLFNYMSKSANVALSKAEGNTLTPHIENSKDSSYSKEVLDTMTEVRKDINQVEKILADSSEIILFELLEKHKDKLTSVFKVDTLEEVRSLMSENIGDITNMESLLFSIGDNIMSKNNVLDALLRVEYEIAEGKTLAIQTQVNNEVTITEKKANQVLAKIGETQDLFRQKDSNGLTSGRIIEKFSIAYEKFLKTISKDIDNALFKAVMAKNWILENNLLTLKFHTLDNDTEFIDVGLLHDIGEGTDVYDVYKTGTTVEAQAYKQDLINKIGQIEYDSIVETQRNFIDAYQQDVENYIYYKLNAEGVRTFNSLSPESQRDITIFKARNNPLTFSEHYKSKGDNLVQYTIGTQSNDATAKLTYNTFIPKRTDNTGKETEYYDAEFDKIAAHPELLNAYTALRKATYLRNQYLSGSGLNMHDGDMTSFKKTATEVFLEKGTKSMMAGLAPTIPNLLRLLRLAPLTRFLGKHISGTSQEYVDDNLIGTPAQIKSYKSDINSQFQNITTAIESILNITFTPKTLIDWSDIQKNHQKEILSFLKMTERELFEIVGIEEQTETFSPALFKKIAQIQTLDSQKADIFLAVKAGLELAAVHKARTEAQNNVRLLIEKSNGLRDFKGNTRENEKKRQKFFYNNILLNKKGKKHYWNISKKFLDWSNNTENSFSYGRMFYKYFTNEEKEVYKISLKRWKQLTSKGIENLSDIEKENLLGLENRMKMMGEDYYASTVFQAIASKLFVTINLAWNPAAQFFNRAQGFTTTWIRDGKYWTKGNVNRVNSFLHKKPFMRLVDDDWAKQSDILRLFIDRLGLVTDGTTELERAEGQLKKRLRVVMPMGLMQWAEDANQTANILCKFMDMKITDNNGVSYPLFDGKKFNGYTIVDGMLALDPNFSNSRNQETFVDMTSNEMAGWKLETKNIISELNGDYSHSGITRIKGSVLGAAAMTYKTWLPRYLSTRWKSEQKNIVTGKVEKGFYLDALTGDNSLSTGFMLAGTTAIGYFSAGIGVAATAGMIPFIPLALGVGFAGFGVAQHISNKKKQQRIADSDGVVVSWQKQTAFVLATLAAIPLMPVNLIAGREVIKGTESILGLDENSIRQKMALETARDIARNMQISMATMALHFAYQMFFGPPDDEEELQGKDGSKQRELYLAQKEQRRKDYAWYYLTTNITGRIFQELNTALDVTALTSTFGNRNTIEGSFQRIAGLLRALSSSEDKDMIQRGVHEGQSKMGLFARKAFLPSAVRYIGVNGWDDPLKGWRGGFETITESEYQDQEIIDKYKITDLKKAKVSWADAVKSKKQEAKKNILNTPMFKKYKIEDDIPVEGLDRFEKEWKLEAKRIVVRENLGKEDKDKLWGKSPRGKFDEDQMLIEED